MAEQPRDRSTSPDVGKNFHFSVSSRPSLGPTQPPIQWVPGTVALEIKWSGHEADYSPATRTEVKKIWFYICMLSSH
jgi:hypothetical protein